MEVGERNDLGCFSPLWPSLYAENDTGLRPARLEVLRVAGRGEDGLKRPRPSLVSTLIGKKLAS